jgi:dTDP-4-dehydrorhamnose reductase
MIQPTTDCVFSGTKGSYTEMDEHDEKGAYGISKSLGEPSECTIIRTSIIGNELRNKKSLLEWVLSNNNRTINGWTNHNWNGITCLQYCKVIETIMIENLFWSGVRHILSPKEVSKYELSKLICDTYNCNITINPIETEKTVDKTLQTIYTANDLFKIPDLSVQIKELRNYSLLE